jgi:osmotically-inducible protein OsmY
MLLLKTRHSYLIYSDEGIREDIWKAVGQHDGIRLLDGDSFSISVKDGFVILTGHLTRKYHRDLVEEIACSTPDVRAVQNDLVVDSELTIEVAERLATDERTRHFIFPVGVAHGWVRVGGVAPRRKLQLAAEEIAAQVPFVRGVLSRPRVIGEYPEIERRAVQPQIQAKVFDYNLQEGIVAQVVIQPRNRLVTHAVVRVSDFYDGKFIFREYLVPVEAMDVVKKESIFLKRNGSHLDNFAGFEPSDYLQAPINWRPPYPYTAEMVLWPCASVERVEDQTALIQKSYSL